jgi:hypothetical protein
MVTKFKLFESVKSFDWTGPEIDYGHFKSYKYFFDVGEFNYKVSISESDYTNQFWISFKVKKINSDDEYLEDIITNTGKIYSIMETVMDIYESNFNLLKNLPMMDRFIDKYPIIYSFTGIRKDNEVGISKRNKLYLKFLKRKFPEWEVEQTFSNGQMKITTN